MAIDKPEICDLLKRLVEITSPQLSKKGRVKLADEFSIMTERWIRANPQKRADVLRAEKARIQKVMKKFLAPKRKKARAAR